MRRREPVDSDAPKARAGAPPAASRSRPAEDATARAGRQGRASGGAKRRSGRPARPERRRQDDHLLHDRGPGARRRRRDHASTASRCRAHADPPARSRSGLSYLPQEASIFRKLTVRGEHPRRARTAARRRRPAAAQRRRSSELLERPAARPEHREAARLAGAGAVGRRAAPRRDRARAGDAAALHPARRAVRRRRPDRGDRDPAHHRLPEAAAASAC